MTYQFYHIDFDSFYSTAMAGPVVINSKRMVISVPKTSSLRKGTLLCCVDADVQEVTDRQRIQFGDIVLDMIDGIRALGLKCKRTGIDSAIMLGDITDLSDIRGLTPLPFTVGMGDTQHGAIQNCQRNKENHHDKRNTRQPSDKGNHQE